MLLYSILLNLVLYFTSCQSQDDGAKSRLVRSVQSPPEPIDCVMSPWSAWSTCDPCQKKRFRYNQITEVPQFLGEPCYTLDRQEEDCTPRTVCRNTKRCEGFQCVESGKCITRRLMCNGDDDCGDGSDEKNCKAVRSSCTDDKMEQFWGIENLAAGMNLLTNNREGIVMDHRYYAGGCSPNYILGTRFRKPYNVETFIPEAKGEYEFKLSAHETYSDFERDFLKEHKKETSFSLSLKIPAVAEIGFSYSDMNYNKFVKKTKRFSQSSSTFISARSEVEVIQYKLKSQGLMLHSEFFKRVKQLPMEYVYGEYRDLYRDYGTHFITEATLGGIYEYTLILNTAKIKKADYQLEDIKSCLSAGLTLGANIYGVYVGTSMSVDVCNSLLKETGRSSSKADFVEDFVALVRGGASEQVTALAYKSLPTGELMQEWGDALLYNPEIIKYKASPILELVTTADFIGANILQQNMKRAFEEFQAETSSCRCAPCQNNGKAVFKENRCECICPLGFKGPACEITKRPVPPIDGNWGCWASWTPCSGGIQSRQRQCNNPSPQNGGKGCDGAPSDSRAC